MSWTLLAFQTAPAGENVERDFLTLSGTLAGLSSHPAAAGLRRAMKAANLSDGAVTGFTDFPDRGFGGLVRLAAEGAPRAVLVGELDLLEESGLQIPAILEVARRRFSQDGRRALVGGWDGYVRGVARFMDPKAP